MFYSKLLKTRIAVENSSVVQLSSACTLLSTFYSIHSAIVAIPAHVLPSLKAGKGLPTVQCLQSWSWWLQTEAHAVRKHPCLLPSSQDAHLCPHPLDSGTSLPDIPARNSGFPQAPLQCLPSWLALAWWQDRRSVRFYPWDIPSVPWFLEQVTLTHQIYGRGQILWIPKKIITSSLSESGILACFACFCPLLRDFWEFSDVLEGLSCN